MTPGTPEELGEGTGSVETKMSPASLHIQQLEISCALLDDSPELLDDEAFWEITGTYFVGLVIWIEHFDGPARWDAASTELERLQRQHVDSLSQLDAECLLGEYIFTKQGLVVQLLHHLVSYAEGKRLRFH